MAQAGLHIPAAPGSRLPGVPQRVRRHRRRAVDCRQPQHLLVARHQHRRRWTGCWRCRRSCCSTSSGSGTDPAEGGALATAVVDHFKSRGALVVCTSHSEAVKTYATTTPGVTVAAFGFDPASFAPSYRLVYGSPGPKPGARDRRPARARRRRSSTRARQNLSARDAQLAEHLAKIDQNLHDLEHERRLVARERQAIARVGIAAEGARGRAAAARGGVPPQDRGPARRAAARRAARDRPGRSTTSRRRRRR